MPAVHWLENLKLYVFETHVCRKVSNILNVNTYCSRTFYFSVGRPLLINFIIESRLNEDVCPYSVAPSSGTA